MGRLKKYGGAGIADLDGDGYADLLLGHHGPQPIQLYFNNGNGTFTLSKFFKWGDTHALNAIRLTPYDRYMHFVLSRGGSFGRKPQPPHLFSITANRDTVDEVTSRSADFAHTRGSARTMIFLSLRMNQKNRVRPDALAINGVYKRGHDRHYMFQIDASQTFHERRTRSDIVWSVSDFGGVTDIDNDGQMEVVLMKTLSIWKLTADFMLTDISKFVLPASSPRTMVCVNAFAELDYDNDGDWDVVVTQAAQNHLFWRERYFPRHTILLENVGGKYYRDSTEIAKIPNYGQATEGIGVTAADFDNDGCVDIFITRYFHSPAMLLLRNLCNGSFKVTPHGFGRQQGVPGAMATAVDYDLDGRVDLVVAEGDWDDEKKGGNYRIVRNEIRNGNGFILVRVKNAPRFSCTSLHAVVTVITMDGVRMMRRVGSPGTAVSISYLETVHFGIGKRQVVQYVWVRWVDGTTSWRSDVLANTTVSFGVDA